jgi:hypothetical protein
MRSRRHARRERSRDESKRLGRSLLLLFRFIRICMLCLNLFNNLVDTLPLH